MNEEDAALLVWLQSGAAAREDDDSERLLRGFLADTGAVEPADLDSDLRELGLSARDRRDVIRPRRRSGQTLNYKSAQLKRYRWYIDQRVDWAQTALDPDHVVGVWADLTGQDLDKARRWWDAGVNPVELELITELAAQGLEPRDLTTLINGHPIRWHLSRGSSVRWCIAAVAWKRRTAS